MNKFRFIAKSVIHGTIAKSGWPLYQRRKLRGKLIILTYHSFCQKWPNGLFHSLPIKQFEKQIRFLKNNFELVSLQEGLHNLQQRKHANKPYLTITIDDGFRDNYTLAWPLLQQYDIPVTIFLTTDFIDNIRAPWPTQLVEAIEQTKKAVLETPFQAELKTLTQRAEVARKLKNSWSSLSPTKRFKNLEQLQQQLEVSKNTCHPPMTWSEIRKMQKLGVQFGSHTIYHSILPKIQTDTIISELRDSKIRLENKLQQPCKLFAYPDGKHNDSTMKALQHYGYNIAVTQDFGYNQNAKNYLQLKRIEIQYNDPFSTFCARTSLAI